MSRNMLLYICINVVIKVSLYPGYVVIYLCKCCYKGLLVSRDMLLYILINVVIKVSLYLGYVVLYLNKCCFIGLPVSRICCYIFE